MKKGYGEYFILKNMLDEITWALEGKCNDIDCNKYMYKDLLKKKYNPIINHKDCISNLKMQKEALMNLLSMKKFRKFRYEKCTICKKLIDSLSKEYYIVSFTRPIKRKGKTWYEYKGIHLHEKCKKSVSTPKGWERSF